MRIDSSARNLLYAVLDPFFGDAATLHSTNNFAPLLTHPSRVTSNYLFFPLTSYKRPRSIYISSGPVIFGRLLVSCLRSGSARRCWESPKFHHVDLSCSRCPSRLLRYSHDPENKTQSCSPSTKLPYLSSRLGGPSSQSTSKMTSPPPMAPSLSQNLRVMSTERDSSPRL